MDMPQPIDVSRLKNILGGAKAIMNKVDTGDYSTGNVDPRALSEEGVQQMMAEGVTRPQGQPQPQQGQPQQGQPQAQPQQAQPQGNQQYKNMATSKMPAAIKEAMMKSPIPQGNGVNHTFNLEDVQPQQPSTPRTNAQPTYEQQIGSNSNGTFTVSETALRAIVNDMLLEFMTQTFTQSLSEDVIKKTIGTLIKEGKINVKKRSATRT